MGFDPSQKTVKALALGGSLTPLNSVLWPAETGVSNFLPNNVAYDRLHSNAKIVLISCLVGANRLFEPIIVVDRNSVPNDG